MTKKALVTGAGGFIGHHLVNKLKKEGYWVRGVDVKRPEYEETAADEFAVLDLRFRENCRKSTEGIDHVYNLAADMGGIGYIGTALANIAMNNTLINAHMLQAAHENKIERYLYTSSACVYAGYKQKDPNITALKEEDAHPADPEPGYGWEKLYAEKLCEYYTHDYNFPTRSVRFHNVYGPLGTYEGGKEKAPAAVCRKVASTENGGTMDIWGDGEQTRSFMYVDDCVEGVHRLMMSDHWEPINLGTEEMISINGLYDLVSDIAGKKFEKKHDLSKPQGVRGRNSDNTKLREVLGWEPKISLQEGLSVTYRWISSVLDKQGRLKN